MQNRQSDPSSLLLPALRFLLAIYQPFGSLHQQVLMVIPLGFLINLLPSYFGQDFLHSFLDHSELRVRENLHAAIVAFLGAILVPLQLVAQLDSLPHQLVTLIDLLLLLFFVDQTLINSLLCLGLNLN